MKLKKVLTSLLAVGMTTALFAGCGSSSSGKKSTSEDGSVSLNMWVHETDSNEGKLYKTLVDEFNEKNKGKISVELTQIPRTGDAGGYDDKVNAALTTGNMPDVFTIDGPSVAANADSGAIVPIGDYFTDDDLKDFNKDIIQQGTYKGKLYTLGAMDSSVLLFYNKDMFAKAGITPATVDNPWTWDEFYTAAKKLTKDGVYGANLGLKDIGEWMTFAFLPMVQSGGSNIVSEDGTADGYLNGQDAIDALTFIKKLVDEKIVNATPEDFTFEKQSSAMTLSGSWEPSTLKDYPDVKWGTMPYPIKQKGAKQVSPCGSWTFGMSKDCKEENREAAAELIKFLTSTDSCKRMYGANSMPPARTSAFKDIKEFNEEPLNVISYQLQNTAVARPVIVNYPVLSDQFAKAVANVVNGMDPKEALDDAAEQYKFHSGK